MREQWITPSMVLVGDEKRAWISGRPPMKVETKWEYENPKGEQELIEQCERQQRKKRGNQ